MTIDGRVSLTKIIYADRHFLGFFKLAEKPSNWRICFSYLSLSFLAFSRYGSRYSLLRARQHLAISFTTSVTLAFGERFKISARFSF